MTFATATPQTARATNRYSFLIIGYGNDLRGDDGVGPQVAKAVADWHLPAVKALAVQQLLPELAADMAQVEHVIFVDACGQRGTSTLQLAPVVTNKKALTHYGALPLNHTCDPLALLTLTQTLYGRHPQAWLLQIPIEHCDLGRSFSTTAQQGAARALRTIEQFFTTYLRRPALTHADLCTKSA